MQVPEAVPIHTTAFARAVKAAQTQLELAAVSANIFRNRARVVPADMATAVVVRPGNAEAVSSVGMGADWQWQTLLVLECYARKTAQSDVDEAVDVLLLAATNAIVADRTLGGVVADLAPAGVHWDFDVDGEKTACATVTFIVQQFTAAAFLS